MKTTQLFQKEGENIHCFIFRLYDYTYAEYEAEFLKDPDQDEYYEQDSRKEAVTDIIEVVLLISLI